MLNGFKCFLEALRAGFCSLHVESRAEFAVAEIGVVFDGVAKARTIGVGAIFDMQQDVV